MAEAFSVAPKSVEDWTWASVSKGKGPNRPVSTIRHLATRPRALPRLRSVSGCVLMNFWGGPHGSAGRARR